MNKKLKAKRDELAQQYENYIYPAGMIQPDYKSGFDAAIEILMPIIESQREALKGYHHKELSHYIDCKNFSDKNEDEDCLFCDCGMGEDWMQAQEALKQTADVLGE